METIIKSNDFSNSRYYKSKLDTSAQRDRYYRYALKSLEMHIEHFKKEGLQQLCLNNRHFPAQCMYILALEVAKSICLSVYQIIVCLNMHQSHFMGLMFIAHMDSFV